MAVRFCVDDGDSPLGFSLSREQAEHLLGVLGEELPSPGPVIAPFAGDWGGSLSAEAVRKQLDALRRQFVARRISEFTGAVMPEEDLIRCLVALEKLCDRADKLGKPIQFGIKE